jgi:hypothetical protein
MGVGRGLNGSGRGCGEGGVGFWPYNKQYIEANIIFSFNEMYNYEFPAILSANLCYCITADQILALYIVVLCWSCLCGFIL